MHKSPSFVRIHPTAPMPPSDPPQRSGLSRSSSAARFSQPNQAHLPTLKMLSDRLGTPPAAAQAAPSALSEMSTNLPAEPTAGRLKLPPSAVARAQISPSPQSGARESKLKGGDTDDRESAKQNGVGSAKENAREIATANAEHKADSSASDNPQATVETNGDGPKATTPPNRGIDERHTDRASLGVGYRAPPPTPQTPLRAAKTAADAEEVPEIVVQTSTPGKGDAAETIEEGEVVEAPVDPNTPLPLAHSWTLFFDSKTYKPESEAVEAKLKAKKMSVWEASLLTVGEFNTVQSFARLMNNIRTPARLAKGANYHLFKDGIRPSWEDPANTHGGKWVLFTKTNDLMDHAWSSLVMALVGEMLDPENSITGIVVSPRPKADRIQVWMRSKDDVSAVNAMGVRIMDTIGAEPHELEMMSLEFQSNKSSETFPPNKFMRIAFTQRSVSAAPSPSATRARLPSSPLGSNSPLSLSPRLAPRSLPMQRGNSGNSPTTLSPNPFTGAMGASRRLVSTPRNGGF